MDTHKSSYATGLLVHNTTPISWSGGYTFTTDSRYQAVEGKSYLSLSDVNTTPWGFHAPQKYTMAGGSLPPGLSLDTLTGIISGTVGTLFDTNIIEDAINAYPDESVSVDGADGGIFRLKKPSQWDTYYQITKTFNFSVEGWVDTPVTVTPPTSSGVLYFSIVVLKDFTVDVQNYNALPEETRLQMGIKEPQS